MKTFVVVRHGEAEAAASTQLGADAARALSAFGRSQVVQTSAWLQTQIGMAKAAPADILLCASPYRRAQETAAILHTQMGLNLPVQTDALLTPDADLRLTVAWLHTLTADTVIVASHMPMVALLVERLAAQSLRFTPATAVVLDANALAAWPVRAHYSPAVSPETAPTNSPVSHS